MILRTLAQHDVVFNAAVLDSMSACDLYFSEIFAAGGQGERVVAFLDSHLSVLSVCAFDYRIDLAHIEAISSRARELNSPGYIIAHQIVGFDHRDQIPLQILAETENMLVENEHKGLTLIDYLIFADRFVSSHRRRNLL